MQKLEILQNIAIPTFESIIKSAGHVGSITLIAMDGYQVSLIDNQKFSQGKKNKAYDRVAKQIDELVDIQKTHGNTGKTYSVKLNTQVTCKHTHTHIYIHIYMSCQFYFNC